MLRLYHLNFAIQTDDPSAGSALATPIARELLPTCGSIRIGDQNLLGLHQAAISGRIGYSEPDSFLFEGTLGDNLMLPFKRYPEDSSGPDGQGETSNPTDKPLDANWIRPEIAGSEIEEEIRDWWYKLVETMGIGDFMVRRILRSTISERTKSELIGAVLSLRAEVEQALKQAKPDTFIHRFDASDYNPVIPLGINLFSGLATASTTSESLAADPAFLGTIKNFIWSMRR
ncbi:hypothetical protein [Ruegeria atlantica]|uniref:hypothetical protein n=1 Tax=Ruegeria atlantica TaxID=81569 RepID=UPI001479B720|nr:hypothetical protein [Ruegeria atlantica]